MTKEEIKESIIGDLKNGGCSPYIDLQEEELSESDWYDIAEAVGSSVMYDPCGLSYTLEGFAEYFKLARYEYN
jgi:hypothetical protein